MTESNTRTIRFGIIGCGIIADLHAESIQDCPLTELVAVSDVSAEKLNQFALKYNVSKTFTNYQELLRQEAIDVISVCTPSGSHGEIVIHAARQHKHVLCEKPLEITSEKINMMINECDIAGVKLGCVYQRRALDTAIAVKKAIDRGDLGKLVLCDAYLKYYRDQAYYDSAGWRGTWDMDGGGALMNQGVHGIDMIQWLAGGIHSIFARVATLARTIEVEDTAVATVQYTNGAFGVIEAATTVYPERSTRFEIHGEKGSIIFDDQGIQEWNVRGQTKPALDHVIPSDQALSGLRSIGHYRFIEDMALALIHDRDPMVTGKEARKAVDIILAMYQSAKQGTDINLESSKKI